MGAVTKDINAKLFGANVSLLMHTSFSAMQQRHCLGT